MTPNGFPTLTWVLRSAGFSMDKEAREAATQVIDAFPAIKAIGTLIDTQGFQGAAVRAVIAALQMMHRGDVPHKVFAQPREAVAWCHRFCRPLDDAAAMTEALIAMRQTLPRP